MPTIGAKPPNDRTKPQTASVVSAAMPPHEKSITFDIETGEGRSLEENALVLMSFQFAYLAMSSFITVTHGSKIGRTQFWAIVKNLLGFGNCSVVIDGFLVKGFRSARYCFWVLPRSLATTLWAVWVL
jgi:hypothetical protein